MPTITTLTLYPIKSCAGISLEQAILTAAGLQHQGVHDREWMVVDAQGQFLTQRAYPRMALVRPEVRDGALVLNFPGMETLSIPVAQDAAVAALQVQVWNDTLAADDCGPQAAAWFSRALGLECRLVRFSAAARRLASKKWTDGQDVPNRFSDSFPMLLVSQASLEDLNGKLQAQGRAVVSMNRFRPNIVIDGVDAFEEDYAAGFANDTVSLKPVKPCARCPMPAVDQATAEVGPNPVDILQSYRVSELVGGGIIFGMNTILLRGEGETLRVGDELEMELAF